MYQRHIKRWLDFLISLAAIVCLSPIILTVAILVRVKLGKPVLFTQMRPGKNGKVFKMYKFRSMTNKHDETGELLSDEDRLTGFGKKLRSTSLDELPELLNILKGEMSIVGPRPQLVRDMVFMTEEENRRHTVRQGLTGLAQIKGRNAISWKEKLQYDIEYIEKITFRKDLYILWQTISAVFKKEGINTEGMATAEDYGEYLLRIGAISTEEFEEKEKIAQQILEENS